MRGSRLEAVVAGVNRFQSSIGNRREAESEGGRKRKRRSRNDNLGRVVAGRPRMPVPGGDVLSASGWLSPKSWLKPLTTLAANHEASMRSGDQQPCSPFQTLMLSLLLGTETCT